MFKKPKTFILVGRSGSGKGTQAEVIKQYLKENDPDRKIFYLETGAYFREFITGNGYSHRKSLEVYHRGARQPDFLAIHIWSHVFINELEGDEHIIIDGTPRSLIEAYALDTALEFYERKNVMTIYFRASNRFCMERLLSRGRLDDQSKEDIERRFAWFDSDVVPVVEYYRTHPLHKFIELNGEKLIIEVSDELLSRIK